MFTGASTLTLVFLGALLLLTAATLIVLLRRSNAGDSQVQRSVEAHANAETKVAILEERLKAREAEIATLQHTQDVLNQTLSAERSNGDKLRDSLSRNETLLQQERLQHDEKLSLLHNAREQMKLEFKTLANDIMEQKGKSFTETSRVHIQELLKPLGDKIQLFEKKVEETYDKESKQRFSLEKEIRTLFELNTKISVDADNLTRALKGESKTQGIWGEVILERVLERSGLQKGQEYDVQVSLKDDEGKRNQPDVLVHLPDDKDVIVDSKVSLTAYEAYFSAEDDEQRALYMRQHIQSIRNHIKGLSAKNYQHLPGVRSLDYVLMFLPVEAAFTLAVQHDDSLFTEAFDKNIILVGPSTLLATLRTIQSIWRYEYQNRHALEIADRAGKLYDKFVAFCGDLEKIGERLTQARDAFDQAQNKLVDGRGNMVSRIEHLKALGARASKTLPAKLLSEASDLEDDEDEQK